MKEEGGVRYSDKHTKRVIVLHLIQEEYPKPKEKALVNADENKSEEKPRKVKKISIAMVNDIFGNMGEYKIR